MRSTESASRDRPLWTTVAFAALAMLVCYLPFSAVNGVLGAIGASTGAGTGDLQWVTDAFTVRQLGGALGAAVIGAVLAARLRAGVDFATAMHAGALTLVILLLGTAAVVAALLFPRNPVPTTSSAPTRQPAGTPATR